jgi:hypothetical protein
MSETLLSRAVRDMTVNKINRREGESVNQHMYGSAAKKEVVGVCEESRSRGGN